METHACQQRLVRALFIFLEQGAVIHRTAVAPSGNWVASASGSFFARPGSDYMGRIHNAHAVSQGAFLTMTHWVGCTHRYWEELGLMLKDFVEYSIEQRMHVSLILVAADLWLDLPVGVDSGLKTADRLNVTTFVKRLGITVAYLEGGPVCCSGSSIEDQVGHLEGTPCRNLLEDGKAFVRMGRLRLSKQHTSGCSRDFACPISGKPWKWTGSGGLATVKTLLWRANTLQDKNLTSQHDWQHQEKFWPPNMHIVTEYHRLLKLLPKWSSGGLKESCALTFFARLPELADLAVVSARAPAMRLDEYWSNLAHSVDTCYWLYRYRYVEYVFNATDFLTRHGIPRKRWGTLPEGSLIVRFCAPSLYEISSFTGGWTNVDCDFAQLGKQLVRMLLFYRFGATGFADCPMPEADDVVRLPSAQRVAIHDERMELPADSAEAFVRENYLGMFGLIAKYRARHAAEAGGRIAARGMTSRIRVAVCIVGMARSLNKPIVYESIRQNVTKSFTRSTEVRYFHLWQLESGRNPAEMADALAALPPTQSSTYGRYGQPRLIVPNLTCALGSCRHIHTDSRRCLSNIEAYEYEASAKFHWILRLRSDVRWVAPIGPLEVLDTRKVHLARKMAGDLENRRGRYQDRFALIPRQFAKHYLHLDREPAICSRMKIRFGTFACFNEPSFLPCECLVDLRLDRLRVPVEYFPIVVSKVDDEFSHTGSGWIDQGPNLVRN